MLLNRLLDARVKISACLVGIWMVFREIETYSRTYGSCHVLTFELGHVNEVIIGVDNLVGFHKIGNMLVRASFNIELLKLR